MPHHITSHTCICAFSHDLCLPDNFQTGRLKERIVDTQAQAKRAIGMHITALQFPEWYGQNTARLLAWYCKNCA
jgi:polyferredoxin